MASEKESVPVESWRLAQGSQLVGMLRLEGIDMFWTDCRFEPGPGWPAVRPLFEASRDAWLAHDLKAALAADERIQQAGLVLIPDDNGEPLRNFIVRIQGDQARFKWW
ncbi:hypothetical protein ACF09H_30020 [Streptomyces sp. NPDC014983]|uniref:hypothetical protein n=1 Tax=Streptomyces sp. NPDC014983 TaxID=3364933 RepID=UPI0036F75FAF